ncbi:Rossmann-like domain-containing protein [Tomitella gaofuii]|uniref:Rossmann-like domain-containing protein n=1 Tax=Tomitella gaofuii TaxID=2760083 RepID=UPI0015FB3CE3|nr:DUF364 domain-containing protein [Tomitella gaofuii]
MPNPWQIYDQLINAIPEELTVVSGAAGMRWCRVVSSDDGLGMSYTMPEQSRPVHFEGPTYVGAPLREIATLAKSWNFAEAGIGMAALNAWHCHPDRVGTAGFTPSPAGVWPRIFHPYSKTVAGKVVSVIGHFPFAFEPLAAASQLHVLERSTHPGDYPDPACEYLLPASDYVFISGSAFVNKTMPRLLELAQHATTIVVGPSTPLSPVLFDHGVDAITGFVATSPAELAESLGGLALSGMLDHGHIVERNLRAG